MGMEHTVWVGWDPREHDAWTVAAESARRSTAVPGSVYPIVLSELQKTGLYTRAITRNEKGQLFDPISNFTMATEFAISRFLTPILAQRRALQLGVAPYHQWALFVDADVMIRGDLRELWKLADPSKAVQVVKHDYKPTHTTKMDGQAQSQYNRKNWSSVMLFNVNHPANAELTVELINTVPGRDLHAFCWLPDELVGELPVEWNYLVGWHTKEQCPHPRIVHFTDGVPRMEGYENCEYADEWWKRLHRALRP